MSEKPIKRVKADWSEVVLVCRKCSKKLKGGFGDDGDQKLAKVLRKAIGAKGKGRKASAAIIEVDCLDVCPKGAVVAVKASAPREWAVVPRGASTDSVVERLGLSIAHPAKAGTQADSGAMARARADAQPQLGSPLSRG